MNNHPDHRKFTFKPKDEPGPGDDTPCSKCGSALDTGLECTECGHDMQLELLSKDGPPARAPSLPSPGSPEASAMMDSVLAEYNYPSNPKNAARAGWVAAMRWLSAPSQAQAAAEPPRSIQLVEEALLHDGPEAWMAWLQLKPLLYAAPVSQAEPSTSHEDTERLDFIEKAWFYQEANGAIAFSFNETWDAGQHANLRAAIDAARASHEEKGQG